MSRCEFPVGCSDPATCRLESRHVNSAITVTRRFCEAHFTEVESYLDGTAYFEVVASEPVL